MEVIKNVILVGWFFTMVGFVWVILGFTAIRVSKRKRHIMWLGFPGIVLVMALILTAFVAGTNYGG